MNRNAIFFGISDNYSFAVANIIMGLKQHSAELMKQCDIIVYHDGISEKNKQLLEKLCASVVFKEMNFPSEWEELLCSKRTARWGHYVIAKLFGFELIKTYEKVLFLDADMLVRDDISDLFEIEEEIAWRDVMSWKAADSYDYLLDNPNIFISAPNGGLIYFTDKLLKYNIDTAYIAEVFSKVKSAKRGGTEELVLSYIVYDKAIKLKEISVNQYNASVYSMLHDKLQINSKIIHFLDYGSIPTKPWKSLVSYLCFNEWADNYEKWIAMGGDGPINFTKEDYYKLYSFDQVDQINALNNRVKKLDTELKENQKHVAELEKKYNDIINSKAWKAVTIYRCIKDKLKKTISVR